MRDNTIETIRAVVLDALAQGDDSVVAIEAQALMHLLEEYDDSTDEVGELEREVSELNDELEEAYKLVTDKEDDFLN